MCVGIAQLSSAMPAIFYPDTLRNSPHIGSNSEPM